MSGKLSLLTVVLVVNMAMHSNGVKAENQFHHQAGNLIQDTTLPVKVISDDNMNIMIDYQKELIAIQWKGLNREDRKVFLTDSKGKLTEEKQLFAGSTLVFFETQTYYEGDYILQIQNGKDWIKKNIKLIKPE